MKPVHLAFAHEGGFNAWLYGHAGWSRWRALGVTLALVVGVVALCGVTWLSWLARQQVGAAQEAIRSFDARLGRSARLASAEAAKPLLDEQQRRDWNLMAGQLNTPWSAILDALETSLPDSVALVSIEPDARHGGVHLQVEAKALDTLLSYAVSLKSIGPFDDVVLIKHGTNDQDPMHPLRLSLEAKLKSRQGRVMAVQERAQ